MLTPALEGTLSSIISRIREIRHDIHKHPELGFEEFKTQAVVRAFLEEHGYQPRVCAETGLVADLDPKKSSTIALRADLDCLPIQEHTDLPWKSVHNGRSHKCGHDGHTAILLGVAAVLAKHKHEINGNVRLLFQPAEEGVKGGGARVMVKEGALDGVREVYGLHNWPGWPKGEVRVKAGAMLAQVHGFTLEITGVGGHASQPQLCRDPIVAGAHLVTALQTVVARGLGYEGGAVVSVGAFNAGTADNIIPKTAKMKGTIQTFDPRITTLVLERVKEVCSGVANTFGVKVDIELVEGYPVVMNDPNCADVVVRVARALVGEAKVQSGDLPIAGGEDFAYFARTVPSAFFFLGAKIDGENTPVCHHPDFDFDDDLIPLGMRMFLGIVADRLR